MKMRNCFLVSIGMIALPALAISILDLRRIYNLPWVCDTLPYHTIYSFEVNGKKVILDASMYPYKKDSFLQLPDSTPYKLSPGAASKLWTLIDDGGRTVRLTTDYFKGSEKELKPMIDELLRIHGLLLKQGKIKSLISQKPGTYLRPSIIERERAMRKAVQILPWKSMGGPREFVFGFDIAGGKQVFLNGLGRKGYLKIGDKIYHLSPEAGSKLTRIVLSKDRIFEDPTECFTDADRGELYPLIEKLVALPKR